MDLKELDALRGRLHHARDRFDPESDPAGLATDDDAIVHVHARQLDDLLEVYEMAINSIEAIHQAGDHVNDSGIASALQILAHSLIQIHEDR